MTIDASDRARVFDATDLGALFAEEPEAFEQFLKDLSRTADECVRAITAASEERDLALLRARAHELKGVAGNVGAQELAACCHRIGEAAKCGTTIDVNAALPALKEAHVRCDAAIWALIASQRR
jgi:two-component system sensor histidine kinase/response regulator